MAAIKNNRSAPELKAAIDIANRQAPPNFINLPIQPVDRSES